VTALAVAELAGRPVVVSGSRDRTVRKWDLATGEPVGAPLTDHTDSVTALAVAELAGRPVVVSGSRDRTVRKWDLATGEPVGGPLTGHTDLVTAVAVLVSDGKTRVVSAGWDGRLRVSDYGSKADLRIDFLAPLLALAFSKRACVVATEQGLVAVHLE
jgi:eukaryotic-like serine/threonine-protein kinase